MQALIAKEKEPITPFIDKISQLKRNLSVSTILVMGGSGDYFEVADTVIAMDNFQAIEVTEKAKTIALEFSTNRNAEGGVDFGKIVSRIPLPDSIDPSRGKRAVKFKVRDVERVVFGTEDIDLAAIEQIVAPGQLRAIASAIVYAKENYLDGKRTISEILDLVMKDIEEQGLAIVSDFPEGDLTLFRRFEFAAVLNRLRSLKMIYSNS
jgi:predicted ABC-class ATPase